MAPMELKGDFSFTGSIPQRELQKAYIKTMPKRIPSPILTGLTDSFGGCYFGVDLIRCQSTLPDDKKSMFAFIKGMSHQMNMDAA